MTALPQIRAVICGGSLDGKTFFAAGISRGLWRHSGFRSLVFDPFKGETQWGPQALVFGPSIAERKAGRAESAGEREFARWRHVTSSVEPKQKFAAFWDEATDWGGRDKENKGLLTAIRHSCPVIFVICHDYASLLPGMRGSISDVFLFARTDSDAKEWAEVTVDDRVRTMARTLKKYEVLHKRKHCEPRVLRYSAAELQAGISP